MRAMLPTYFQLRLAYEPAAGRRQLHVTLTDHRTGNEYTASAGTLSFPAWRHRYQRALQEHVRRPMPLTDLQALGQELAETALPPPIRAQVMAHLPRGDASGNVTRLHLRLTMDHAELQAIPWEYLYLDDPNSGG